VKLSGIGKISDGGRNEGALNNDRFFDLYYKSEAEEESV
jgi:hypothetical protein